MVTLAQAQLSAQFADISANAAGALTLAGIDATLIGVAIAGAGQLGQNYRIVLVGLLLSALTFLLGTQTGTRSSEPTLGPRPSAFYERFGAVASSEFELQLLADLGAAFDANARILQVQVARLLRAALLMIAMLVYSVFLALSSDHGVKQRSSDPHGHHVGAGAKGFHPRWTGHIADQPGSGIRCSRRAGPRHCQRVSCHCGGRARDSSRSCRHGRPGPVAHARQPPQGQH